ncbi:MAG TPA: redoxin domain-containing protein [bacterium]|nr:redoxin domain-containing protein [bacterium]
MSTTRYKVAIIALLIVNALLLAKQFSLSNPGQKPLLKEYVSRAALPAVSVIDRTGRSWSLREVTDNSPASLFVFFSPADCPPCLEERSLWNHVTQEAGIPVFGIGTWPSPSEYWDWTERMEFSMPTFLDTTFTLPESMGLRVMPLKVLVSQDGVIRWADPARLSANAAEEFREDLSDALASLR